MINNEIHFDVSPRVSDVLDMVLVIHLGNKEGGGEK